jgi:hypothetical protein
MSTKKDVGANLTEAANESLMFLTKAFRGAVRLDEGESKRLLHAATATVGAWSRYEATQSNREQTRMAMAAMLAREEGGSTLQWMRRTMPNHSVVRSLTPTALPSGEAPIDG